MLLLVCNLMEITKRIVRGALRKRTDPRGDDSGVVVVGVDAW